MKYFFVVIIFFIGIHALQSQTYEVGGIVGGANYIGDVGPTNYISPNDLAIGGILRWNRSDRHSFRFTALFAGLKSNDLDSDEQRRKERGLSFKNRLIELAAGIEFTFWEFDVHSSKVQSAPYLYTGLTFFNYESLFLDRNNQLKKYGNDWAYAIPMVVGYKTTVIKHIILGFEIGARYTFTDNLDGSNPTGEKENQTSLKFGNINSNDWYVFTGINITFTFGRQPCYCNF